MTRVVLVVAFILLSTIGNGQSPKDDVARWQKMSDAEFLQGAHLEGGDQVRLPTVKQQVPAAYTAAAMRLRIQGTVIVQAIVMPDGSVSRARVVESLDQKHGLDTQAVLAVLKTTYVPESGTFAGRPVPVALRVVVRFQTH